ncbi:MAG: imidazoleglycerol-phosphate dehydratase HisB [Planctomycetota bacterium]|jgi:imidazoleglycerol-phosphate dehydratase|nr:imidazoleglycerol-phosphate dehydratase HisB [Planctomycetota bacterium]MDG2144300.1 imidazoleglycerol-phosphate dehydratase HisB [Planctomycetota bacterium]
MQPVNLTPRTAFQSRTTSEVDIELKLNLDGTGQADIKTGLAFLDHMLTALVKHSRIDLQLIASGDLHVDDHHTVEDCAMVLGRALGQALGDGRGITRFGYAFVPLDEALARAVVDLSGRPWPSVKLGLTREMLGQVATENLEHFLNSLAIEGRFALHVNLLSGTNDHHRAEAAFKAVALALGQAIQRKSTDIPSTKGTL